MTSLGVMANQVDEEAGEDGEEDEDDELRHRMIVNKNSEILREASPSSVVTKLSSTHLIGFCDHG